MFYVVTGFNFYSCSVSIQFHVITQRQQELCLVISAKTSYQPHKFYGSEMVADKSRAVNKYLWQ